MKWVRLENNIVKEIIPVAATAPSVAHWYGDEFAAQCLEAPDEVDQNWIYDPGTDTFSVPVDPDPVEPEPTADERLNAILEGYYGEIG